MSVPIEIVQLEHASDLPLPSYATSGSAGADLLAAVEAPVEIAAGGRALIPTGLCMAIPEGYEVQVRPRSGLALKSGISVLNSPGTIDSDYRGEVGVILVNLGDSAFTIERGMRIAQLVVAPVEQARFDLKNVLSETQRGAGGFGSTGTTSRSGDPS